MMSNVRKSIVLMMLLVFTVGIAESRTIGYWEFNDGADPAVLEDLSGNGNDGDVTADSFYNGDGTATF
ncbi:MAG: hypothetical protein GY799_19805, partial [Desulfobulbaceae bacterium]|nr:hypothetical protein [Desulfobulbaceae bacterium]